MADADVNKDKNDDVNKDKNDQIKDDKIDKTEFTKVVNQRQELKERLRETEKQLEELSKFKTEYESLKSKLDEAKTLKDELDKIKRDKEEQELAKKSESEREAILARKELEKFKEQVQSQIDEKMKMLEEKDRVVETLEQKVTKLRTVSLESQIREAAEKYNAYSPKQIVNMLKDRFDYDEQVGFMVPIYESVLGEKKMVNFKDVDTFVKDFLSDDENANLVRSSHKRGIEVDVNQNDNTNKDKKGKTKLVRPEDSKYSIEEIETQLKKWAEYRKLDMDFAIGMYNIHKDKLFKL